MYIHLKNTRMHSFKESTRYARLQVQTKHFLGFRGIQSQGPRVKAKSGSKVVLTNTGAAEREAMFLRVGYSLRDLFKWRREEFPSPRPRHHVTALHPTEQHQDGSQSQVGASRKCARL